MDDVYEFKCREASRRIIELRTQAGMTQEQLAEKLGVSSQTIKNYEKAGSGNVRGTESDTRSNAIAGMKIETNSFVLSPSTDNNLPEQRA